MKVQELMSHDPVCCRATDHLGEVAWKMYEGDCGVLPVLGENGEAVGMITDRDIAIAVTTQNKSPSEISVAEVMTGRLHACGPDDEVESALETMAAERVRRLPVLDADRKVVGVLSLNDFALRVGRPNPHLALTRQFLVTLRRISEHPDRVGAPTAAEILGDLGRYVRTEEAASAAALLERNGASAPGGPKKRKARKPASRKRPRP